MRNSNKHISTITQKISSDNLYHYTNKESLISILQNGFKPSYCRELIVGSSKKIDFAVPMVCFCDIPFELSEDHRKKYNCNYAIGLSKEWRIKNRLNPIMYLNEYSILWENISDIFNLIIEMEHKESMEIENKLSKDGISYLYNNPPEVAKLKNILFSMITMMKPYIGIRYDSKGNSLCDNYKFYDEREWRFVLESLPKYIINENGDFEKIKKQPINNHFLKFNIQDIRHIILNNKDEKNEINELLKSKTPIGGNHINESFDISLIKITSINI